jgi:hypothetical protein
MEAFYDSLSPVQKFFFSAVVGGATCGSMIMMLAG